MRVVMWVCAAGLWGNVCGAAPVPAGTPPAPVALGQAFYALVQAPLASLLGHNYWRKEREDVWMAAMSATYAQAGLELPDGTREAMQAAWGPHPDAGPAFIDLIVSLRTRLGDREELRNGTDIAAARRSAVTFVDWANEPFDRLAAPVPKESCLGFHYSAREPFEVFEVVPGLVAQRGGLLPGDQITKVQGPDGQVGGSALFHDCSFEEKKRLLTLTVFRRSTGTMHELKLHKEELFPDALLGVRRKPQTEEWEYFLDAKRTALIRVPLFDERTAGSITPLVKQLLGRGMRALVLDLRGAPDAPLRGIVEHKERYPEEFAAAFLQEGQVVATAKGVQTWRAPVVEKKFAVESTALPDFPIAVLVNRYTSGGHELVAAALQKNGRARVYGARTAGNCRWVWTGNAGSERWTQQISFGEFLDPNGNPLTKSAPTAPRWERWGVEPDETVPVTDAAMRAVQEEWRLFSLQTADAKTLSPADRESDAAVLMARDALAPRR